MRLQRELRHKDELSIAVADANNRILGLEVHRRKMGTAQGLVEQLNSMSAAEKEAAMKALLQALLGHPQILAALAKYMMQSLLSGEMAMRAASEGVRLNQDIENVELFDVASAVLAPSDTRLAGTESYDGRLQLLSNLFHMDDALARAELLNHLLTLINDDEIRMLIR